MKKILAFFLAMLMAFPLFACFGGEEPDTQTSEVTTEEETTEEPEIPETTEATQPETTEEIQPETTEAPEPETTEAPEPEVIFKTDLTGAYITCNDSLADIATELAKRLSDASGKEGVYGTVGGGIEIALVANGDSNIASDVYSIAIAMPMRFLSEISPFCSKRIMLLTATPDFSATCSRVIFFSMRRARKSAASFLAISSVLSIV